MHPALCVLSAAVTRSASSVLWGEGLQVGLLAFHPGARPVACLVESIAAGADDPRDLRAELPLNFGEHPGSLPAGCILHGVMQQAADGGNLASSVFEHQRTHTHQVRQIGHPATLPHLVTMVGGRVDQSIVVPGAEITGPQSQTCFHR